MSFVDAVKTCFNKFADFNGRATRSEYWYFVLFNFLADAVLEVIGIKLLLSLFSLIVLIPGIAVAIRRMHDIGRSGWWLLIALVPLAGPIALIVFAATDSQMGDNQYGPCPKY